METLIPKPLNNFVGLNKDAYYNKQPTYILNGILESFDGEQGIITSEQSNKPVYSFGFNHKITGKINMSNNEIAIFTTDENTSVIHLVKENSILNSYTIPNFNFSRSHLIQGTFKIIKGCERVIYWNDNHRNPDRYFNFDDINSFKTGGVFDPTKFSLNPNKSFVDVKVLSVNDSGGSLEVGQYFFQADVLDDNQRVVYSSLLSNSVVVYDELQSLSYNQIDGAYNYPAFAAEIGGVTTTNKSITVQFKNLDSKYSYIRLKVLKFVSADKVTKSAHIINSLIPIVSNNQTFVYSGFNVSNGDYTVDSSELTIVPSYIESSSYMEQVQNRLVRANVKEKKVDYSTFQSYANQITSKYTVKEVEFKNPQAEGSDKNPLTYQDYVGYMSDEVYAFGIVYVLKDGSISPAFHIPGREANIDDLTDLVAGTDVSLDNVKHIDSTLNTGDLIPKWKLLNTAITSTNDFAYYEDEQEEYPYTTDCNGTFIWANIRGEKIRHHKFPDRQKVPLVSSNGKLNVLGITFNSVIYPDNVVGHFFVKGVRDDLNKTVLDNGYSATHYSNTTTGDAVQISTYQDDLTPSKGPNYISTFISPKTYLKTSFVNGGYLRNLLSLTSSTHTTHNGYRFVEDLDPSLETDGFKLYQQTLRYYYGKNYYNSSKVTNYTPLTNSFLIEKSGYVKEKSTSNFFDYPVVSNNFLNAAYCIKTNLPISNNTTGFRFNYSSIKNYKSVYSNLYFISYEKIGELNQNTCFNGDSFLSTTPIEFGFKRNVLDGSNNPTNTIQYFGEFYVDLIFESEVNIGMRHSGTLDSSTYYPDLSYQNSTLENYSGSAVNGAGFIRGSVRYGDMSKYLRTKMVTKATPDDLLKETPYTTFLRYNPNFDKISNPQLFFSIQSNYDYCSDCINQYKQRIIYSEKSFTEETQDAYLNYKTNNYIDLPANRGEITGLKYKDGLLIVHTFDSSFILKPNPQIITTNQSDIVLGTGDFLSIPPQELLQADLGYAGCQSRLGMVNTPYGYCWVDEKAGQIFMYDKSLEDLSQIGMINWFSENLADKGLNVLTDMDNDNPYVGNACILNYDPRYKRLILTKHNYKVLPAGESQGLHFDGLDIRDNSNIIRYFDEDSIFENKSFTISFSFPFKVWTSFHSYIPLFQYFDENTFYTTITGNNVYSHDNKYSFRSFYGTRRPFVIEYFTHDFTTNTFENLEYVSQCKTWDNTTNSWNILKNITFNKLWCYSKTQSTGLLNLVYLNQNTNPFGNLGFNFTTKNVIQTDKNYKVAAIYANKNNSPVKTNEWNSIKSQYPIDYIPVANDTIIQTNLQKLKDKECFIRLIYDDINTDNNKLSLYLTNTNNIMSIR